VEAAFSQICEWIAALAWYGELARDLDLPPDLREALEDVGRRHAEAIRLLRAERPCLEADARGRGLRPRDAEEATAEALYRDFVGVPYRQVLEEDVRRPPGPSLRRLRHDVRRKLRRLAPTLGEDRIQGVLHTLARLLYDPSGVELRSASTAAEAWSADADAYYAHVAQDFAEELTQLRREWDRLDALAYLA
jgi:hypothetical protein